MEREKDRISLAVSVISKLGGMPTSTQIANWAFEEADETAVNRIQNIQQILYESFWFFLYYKQISIYYYY